MEILYFVILVIGVVVFASGRKKSGKHRTPPTKAIPEKATRSKHRSFDATSIRITPTKTVLEGPAYVVDGDTVVIKKTQIRLFGVDAPEMNHPYGKKAKWALMNLCKGQTVHAEVTEQDTHGRTVAKCYLEDGRDLSAEMVKLGLALDWPFGAIMIHHLIQHPVGDFRVFGL